MSITEDRGAFNEAILDTPFNAPCVKKKGKTLRELVDDEHSCGLLVSPPVSRRILNSQSHLNQIVTALNQPVVRVRGHGWVGEVPFVWTGTTEEFNETWEVD